MSASDGEFIHKGLHIQNPNLDPEFLQVVMDAPDPCPYLPGQTARMPLRIPVAAVQPEQLDALLGVGYRRTGVYFYRTQCPNCQACEATRLEVAKFVPRRSQKRVLKKGDQAFEIRLAPPLLDAHRVELFNRHRRERDLDQSGRAIDLEDYQGFLLNAPCPSLELSLWMEGELRGVSITDVGANGLSAVYCFFDPSISALSPGTYAILQQVRMARELGRKWLYLGYYVRENRHLNYKANFRPQQRLQGGQWKEFE